MTGPPDKHINDCRRHAKPEQRFDIGGIVQHMQQSRPEMAGIIGIHAGEQVEPGQIHDADQQ